MKHFVCYVTSTGDTGVAGETLALVRLEDDGLAELAKMRTLAVHINSELQSLHRSFAHLALWTTDVTWVVADREDEAKIFAALDAADNGVIEVPEDVYTQRCSSYREQENATLRTELDYMQITERGICFTCVEKHADAGYESHFIAWHVLFNEPAPAPPSLCQN